MRIISFSDAVTQPFWSGPVQALAPWITRIKHSLGQMAELSSTFQAVDAVKPPFSPGILSAASNDPVFSVGPTASTPPNKAIATATARSTLRIVRESDAAIHPECAGRMVISGRMADVCAELDRMALRAAAAGTES